MAKTVNPAQVAYIKAQEELANHGLEHTQIDRLLTKSAIEDVMKDLPALRNYFGTALKGLYSITQWDFDFTSSKAVSGSVQAPEHFSEFYQYDVTNPVALRDFIPLQYLQNPQTFADQKILSQDQANALNMLLHGQGPAQEPSDPGEAGTASSGYSGGGKNYGSGSSGSPGAPAATGKAYGTGGVGKAYGTKSLGGSGGPPGPPPMPSGGGMPPYYGPPGGNSYSTPTVPNMDRERDYINTLNSDPNYGLLQMVFESEYGFRSFSTGIMSRLDQIRSQRNQLTQALANLDPRDPNQARQLLLLQQQAKDMDTTERELMDRMGVGMRAKDELVTLVKSMMDTNFKTMQAVIANVK